VNSNQLRVAANFTNTTATWSAQVTSPAASNTVQFQVRAAVSDPVISGITPNPLTYGSSADTITINGSGFVAGCTVTLKDLTNGGTFPMATTFVNANQIKVTANFTNATATWSAQVTSPATSNTVQFQVRAAVSAPVISSVSPAAMAAADANQTLTLTGSNFVSGATLSFVTPGGLTIANTASKLAFVSATQLTYQFNNGSDAGIWTVKVINPGAQASGTASFTVTAPSLNPADDYPHSREDFTKPDPWLFFYRECTSYMAWKINKSAGVVVEPWLFNNHMRPEVSQARGRWSDAENWDDRAVALGFEVDSKPAVGAVAQWNPGEQGYGVGHVAYVEAVNANGSVNISEYNFRSDHAFGTRQNVNPPRFLHIVVRGSDTQGPTLVIAPVANTVLNANLTITGTASDGGRSDNGIASVTVNGTRASGDTTTGAGTANWTRTVSLSPGLNSIAVVAKDNSANRNTATQTLTVTYTPSPSPIFLTAYNENGVAGQPVTLRAMFEVDNLLGFRDSIGDLPVEIWVDGVKAGTATSTSSGTNVSFNYPIPANPGKPSFSWYAKFAGNSSYAAQQSATKSIAITTQPDPLAATLALTLPGQVMAGQPLAISWRVRNTGSAARSFQVSAEIRQGSSVVQPLESRTTASLAPNAEDTVSFNYDTPATLAAGAYTARVAVWSGAPGATDSTQLAGQNADFRVTVPSAPSARPDPSIAPGIRFSLPIASDSLRHYYFDRNSAAGAVLAWNGKITDGVADGAYDGHRGTDFSGLPRNTDVLAVADGTLMEKEDGQPDGNLAETIKPNGNFVRINHGNDSTGAPIMTVYLHLTKDSVTTKAVNTVIKAGDRIGGIGMSGQADGLHLHFEAQRGANRLPFDPYSAAGETSWWKSSGTNVDHLGADWMAAGAGHFTSGFASAPDLIGSLSRTKSDVTAIVIHTTEDGSYGAAIKEFQNFTGETSAHYLVQRNGSVVQFVREKDIAHHAATPGISASWIWNKHTIGIEVERLANSTEGIADVQYRTVKNLIDSIRTRFDVPLVFPTVTARSSPTVLVSGIVAHGKPVQNDMVNGDPVKWDWAFFKSIFTSVAQSPTVTSSFVNGTATSVMLGGSAAFSVSAIGSGPLNYEWQRKPVGGSTWQPVDNDAAYSGAATAILTVRVVVAEMNGDQFRCIVRNSFGASEPSVPATLAVTGRSYAGSYFGTFGSDGGTFAVYVRADNSGSFLGYARGAQVAFVTQNLTVDDAGRFRFSTTASPGVTASSGESPPRAAAVAEYFVDCVIGATGSLSGTISGLNLSLSGARSAASGSTQTLAGFYRASAPNTAATTYGIVSPTGQAYVLNVTPQSADGGTGTADASGRIMVSTAGNTQIVATVQPQSATITASVTSPGSPMATYIGGSDRRIAAERLVNISARATNSSTSADPMIAGFVVSGTSPKQVLVRGIGPALREFGVGNALSAAKLELFRGPDSIASNAGWSVAPNAPAIATVSARVGAFPLPAGGRDAALLMTLPPGAYTTMLTGTGNTGGVSLIEIYDAAENIAAGERAMINISTRARVGTGQDILIAGLVISGEIPKRVLVRGIGSALAGFGVPGVLVDPQLKIFQGNTIVAANDNWSSDPAASSAAQAASASGAFPLAPGSRDAALLLNLAPGAYTVQISGVGGGTGNALVEIYEVP